MSNEYRIIERYREWAEQIGPALTNRAQAIRNARDLFEQELLNGWSGNYRVVDAQGAVIYDSENDHEGRIREAREQSLTRVMKPTE